MTATTVRIALASLPIPRSPRDSLEGALRAIEEAGRSEARVVCFPEAYVPGYPWPGRAREDVDASFLEHAHAAVADAARSSRVAVVLGTERIVSGRRRLTALVLGADGELSGYQDKVQLDPSEDPVYEPGTGRRLFTLEGLRFGVVLCHEGFRYPETVRWAARRGAQLVFHPYYDEAVPGAHRPTVFADPRGTFHEKAFLCRAAENGCFFAAVNCASPSATTTSAVVSPDGTLLRYQPHGEPGLLLADLDLSLASGLLADRLRATDAE